VSDPTFIGEVAMRNAYDALGLDGEGWNSTRLIEIEPHEVRVTRYLRTESGSVVIVGEPIEAVTETIVVPLGSGDPGQP